MHHCIVARVEPEVNLQGYWSYIRHPLGGLPQTALGISFSAAATFSFKLPFKTETGALNTVYTWFSEFHIFIHPIWDYTPDQLCYLISTKEVAKMILARPRDSNVTLWCHINQHQSTPININQHKSASISINQNQPASTSINQHQSASISIIQHLSPSIRVNHYQLESKSINQHELESISFIQHQSPSIRVNHYQLESKSIKAWIGINQHHSASVTVNQSQSLSIKIQEHQSAWIGINQNQSASCGINQHQ